MFRRYANSNPLQVRSPSGIHPASSTTEIDLWKQMQYSREEILDNLSLMNCKCKVFSLEGIEGDITQSKTTSFEST